MIRYDDAEALAHMFLISRSAEECRRALGKMQDAMGAIPHGPVTLITLPGHVLAWFSGKVSDNLHSFTDGYLIGKIAFGEKRCDGVISHSEGLPQSFHPLLTSVLVRLKDGTTTIEPQGTANVYYSGHRVSDMQVLIADAAGYRPAPGSFAVLATVGYLPGTLTLFSEIQKIDLFQVYELETGHVRSVGSFEAEAADDDRMIHRLLEVVPRGPACYLAMSGGYDSRFIAGLLLGANVAPTLLHFPSPEEHIVEQIAKELSLQLIITPPEDPLPPEQYTILTDAQIYMGGGNYSRMRSHVRADSIYHLGHSSGCLIKGAHKTAWKIPCLRSQMPDRLIKYALLNGVPETIPGLRHFGKKTEIAALLRENLSPWCSWLARQPRTVAANWFYYYNRGIRWAQANVSELQYFTHVVLLLSDVTALKYGIGRGAWSSLRKEAARRLNHRLLPQLKAPYDDGNPARPEGMIPTAIGKVKFEYLDRVLAHFWHSVIAEKALSARIKFPQVEDQRIGGDLSDYLSVRARDLVGDKQYRLGLRRASVTLHYLLSYLSANAPSITATDENHGAGPH